MDKETPMKRTLFYLAILSFLILMRADSASAQISDKMVQEDERLKQHVSITASHMYLKELLAELSRKTGVTVQADEKDMAPAIEMMARFDDIALSDVLNSLWTLISNSNSRYIWLRSGKADKQVYSLFEPYTVKSRGIRMREYAMHAYEEYIDTLCNLAELSPQERKEKKSLFHRVLQQSQSKSADAMYDTDLTWVDAALFSELFPKERRHAVLFGGESIDIPFEQASDKAKQLFAASWKGLNSYTVSPDGTKTPVPMPKRIHIYAAVSLGSEMMPAITMQHGTDYSGSLISSIPMDDSLRHILKERWAMLPDEWTNPAELKPLPETTKYFVAEPKEPAIQIHPPKIDNPNGLTEEQIASFMKSMRENQRNIRPLRTQLMNISKMLNIPLLAVLPEQLGSDKTFAKGQLLEEVFKKLDDHGNLMHKWRNNVLLISYPKWFYGEPSSVTYAVLKPLLDTKDGIIDMKALVKFVGMASDAQMLKLAENFPVLRGAYPMRHLLLFAGYHNEILQTRGIQIDEEILAFLKTIPKHFQKADTNLADAERIRLVQFAPDPKKPRDIVIRPECFINGMWESLGGFIQMIKRQESPK